MADGDVTTAHSSPPGMEPTDTPRTSVLPSTILTGAEISIFPSSERCFDFSSIIVPAKVFVLFSHIINHFIIISTEKQTAPAIELEIKQTGNKQTSLIPITNGS